MSSRCAHCDISSSHANDSEMSSRLGRPCSVTHYSTLDKLIITHHLSERILRSTDHNSQPHKDHTEIERNQEYHKEYRKHGEDV